jgi:hypothetical protein
MIESCGSLLSKEIPRFLDREHRFDSIPLNKSIAVIHRGLRETSEGSEPDPMDLHFSQQPGLSSFGGSPHFAFNSEFDLAIAIVPPGALASAAANMGEANLSWQTLLSSGAVLVVTNVGNVYLSLLPGTPPSLLAENMCPFGVSSLISCFLDPVTRSFYFASVNARGKSTEIPTSESSEDEIEASTLRPALAPPSFSAIFSSQSDKADNLLAFRGPHPLASSIQVNAFKLPKIPGLLPSNLSVQTVLIAKKHEGLQVTLLPPIVTL